MKLQARKTVRLLAILILMGFIVPLESRASDRGLLREFCDSSSLTYYFYAKGNSKDISHMVSYNKKYRRNVLDSSIDPKEGNKILKDLHELARMGLTYRCQEVIHQSPFRRNS